LFKGNVRVLSLFFEFCRISRTKVDANSGIDDPEVYHGAPVAVQIIGRRLTEERVMAIAEEVGRLLGNEITP
jgi:Asp-tRNA(Asn)/Glu-tRNA(Gln) amidotransferase A subunit family amidase